MPSCGTARPSVRTFGPKPGLALKRRTLPPSTCNLSAGGSTSETVPCWQVANGARAAAFHSFGSAAAAQEVTSQVREKTSSRGNGAQDIMGLHVDRRSNPSSRDLHLGSARIRPEQQHNSHDTDKSLSLPITC